MGARLQQGPRRPRRVRVHVLDLEQLGDRLLELGLGEERLEVRALLQLRAELALAVAGQPAQDVAGMIDDRIERGQKQARHHLAAERRRNDKIRARVKGAAGGFSVPRGVGGVSRRGGGGRWGC